MASSVSTAPWRHGNCEVTLKKNDKHVDSVVGNLSTMWGTSKGLADLFGNLQRGGALATACLAEGSEVAELTSRVSSGAGAARNWMSGPYALTLFYDFYKDRDVRNLVEGAAMTGYGLTNFLPKDALSKTIGSCASTLKTGVDAVDLKRSVKAYSNLSASLVEAEKPELKVSDEVKTALKGSLRETTLKVAKYFLGVLSGLVGVSAFLFGVVVSPAVAFAALVASTAGIILSFAADYQRQSMPWHAKVTQLA